MTSFFLQCAGGQKHGKKVILSGGDLKNLARQVYIMHMTECPERCSLRRDGA